MPLCELDSGDSREDAALPSNHGKAAIKYLGFVHGARRACLAASGDSMSPLWQDDKCRLGHVRDCALLAYVCQVCSQPLSDAERVLARSDRWTEQPTE